MAKKWLQALDKLAKKGSNAGGKLGIISKAVDAIIPDATTEDAKNAKALGDTNTGGNDATTITNTPDKVDQARLLAEMASKMKDERSWQQKWGDMSTIAKGGIIAGAGALVFLLVKSMTGKKRRY